MNGIAELIESELSTAILKQDKDAIKRFSLIVGQKIDKMNQIEDDNKDIKSDVKVIAEIVKQGFEEMNIRFEDMQKYMNKRFEDMQKNMNKRFEDMQKYMDKRFEDMDKRFSMMFKFMSLGFTVITIIIVVFKLLK